MPLPHQPRKNNPDFTIDLEKILAGEDSRTTIMIRHIPNKYTQEMLLKRINRMHKGKYDFFYLPMDLNNGCNIGYAFINFVDPAYIVPFFEDMNGKSWEHFNSEKICQIAYGRIQGMAALIDNVNHQLPEKRTIKPVMFEVNADAEEIQRFRNELIEARKSKKSAPAYQQTRSSSQGSNGLHLTGFFA
jgi:hypothetical protein